MKHLIEVDLKWFNFSQNNSGGYFITNDVVACEVLIQARNAAEAIERAERIFEGHSEYCDCCGERWSFWVDDKDGTDAPEIAGTAIHEVRSGMFRNEARLHHFDGRIESVSFAGAKA
jgi:hypothetical protein